MSYRLQQFVVAFNEALNERRFEIAAQLCEGVSLEQYPMQVAILRGMEEARSIAKNVHDKMGDINE